MPVFASPEPVPSDDDLAFLRRLIGADERTDEELTPYLERNRCTVVDEGTGEESTTPDHYGAAAEVWEERAIGATAAAATAGPAVVSRRHGDAAETYATGAEVGGSPRAMFAIAARLRRRSCNWSGASTIAVAPPSDVALSRLDALDDADVRTLNLNDRYDRNAIVNAAGPRD